MNGGDLVDLPEYVPGLRLDLRYATARNFTGRVLQVVPRALLVRSAALRLRGATRDFAVLGLAPKVFDAYRPSSVQSRLWEACPDPRFVAPPGRGSRHSRGAAVDLTLVHADSGVELDMGTDFDDFGPLAATDAPGLEERVRSNRRLMHEILLRHGFMGIPSEWWHFDAEGWEALPLLDIPIPPTGPVSP
jgi:D-alanyl-D-alanine dipeptidase